MARKNSIISFDLADDIATFTVTDAGDIVLNLAALSDDIRREAMVHGLRQKVSDAAAIPKADLPADPVEAAKTKFAAMQAVAARLIAGEWSGRSGDGAGPVAGIIYRAYEEFALTSAAAKKATITVEQIRAAYDAKTRSEQLALRGVPAIAAIMDRIRAEKGTSSTVDADSLLADLGI